MDVKYITEDKREIIFADTPDDVERMIERLRSSLIDCRFILLQQESTYVLYVYKGKHDLFSVACELMTQLHLNRSAFQGAGRLTAIPTNSDPPRLYGTGAEFDSHSCMKGFQFDRPKDDALAGALITEIGDIAKMIYNS